jgi:hypothetical protein
LTRYASFSAAHAELRVPASSPQLLGGRLPAVTAGYSGTPLCRKLGIKDGHVVALLGEPAGWRIEGLPDTVVLRRRALGPIDVIVAFFGRRAKLERRLPALARALRADGGLWIAWPRKSAGHDSDISENALREIVLPTGLVDVKVAALDEHWSGLKFVWRKELRAKLPDLAPRGVARGGPAFGLLRLRPAASASIGRLLTY